MALSNTAVAAPEPDGRLSYQESMAFVELPSLPVSQGASPVRRFMSTQPAYVATSDYSEDSPLYRMHSTTFGGTVYAQSGLVAYTVWKDIEEERGVKPEHRLGFHVRSYPPEPNNQTHLTKPQPDHPRILHHRRQIRPAIHLPRLAPNHLPRSRLRLRNSLPAIHPQHQPPRLPLPPRRRLPPPSQPLLHRNLLVQTPRATQLRHRNPRRLTPSPLRRHPLHPSPLRVAALSHRRHRSHPGIRRPQPRRAVPHGGYEEGRYDGV